MTEKMIENRVKKLQAIEAQQKELEAQAGTVLSLSFLLPIERRRTTFER